MEEIAIYAAGSGFVVYTPSIAISNVGAVYSMVTPSSLSDLATQVFFLWDADGVLSSRTYLESEYHGVWNEALYLKLADDIYSLILIMLGSWLFTHKLHIIEDFLTRMMRLASDNWRTILVLAIILLFLYFLLALPEGSLPILAIPVSIGMGVLSLLLLGRRLSREIALSGVPC